MRYRFRRLLAAAIAAAMASALTAAAAGAAARPSQLLGTHRTSLSHRAATPGGALWISRYRGGYAQSIAASPRGGMVFVTGSTSTGALGAITTVAYRVGTGARVWLASYSGSDGSNSYGWSVAVSPDGGTVFAVGKSDSNYTTIAYDATTGAKLWAAQYHDSSNAGGEALHVAVSPSGRTVFVTGTTGNIFTDINTVAYDAATGAQLWAAKYSAPEGGADDWPYGMAVSPDGQAVYVTGGTVLSTGYAYITLGYNAATGAKLWQKTLKGLSNKYLDAAYSVAVSPDANTVYVTGESGGTSGPDCATIAYSAATGTRLWLARHHNPSHGINRGTSVVASPDGSTVFVTGWTSRADSHDDYLTIAYRAATGTKLWLARYNGPANSEDNAVAAAVNRAGTVVYVTGNSWGTAEDYATVAYAAATGTQLWAARYNGPGNYDDSARAIAVSPDGTAVYVTGNSTGTGSTDDYATIAYGG